MNNLNKASELAEKAVKDLKDIHEFNDDRCLFNYTINLYMLLA